MADPHSDEFLLSGGCSPRQMPKHLFHRCIRLDYKSALKADVTKQDFSVFPRHWYVDATISCILCKEHFVFPAQEQKVWYEVYRFWIDSFPNKCRACRRKLQELKAMRQEYDRDIAGALASEDCDLKTRVASLVDQLREAGEELPAKVLENRELLARQIARRSRENL